MDVLCAFAKYALAFTTYSCFFYAISQFSDYPCRRRGYS